MIRVIYKSSSLGFGGGMHQLMPFIGPSSQLATKDMESSELESFIRNNNPEILGIIPIDTELQDVILQKDLDSCVVSITTVPIKIKHIECYCVSYLYYNRQTVHNLCTVTLNYHQDSYSSQYIRDKNPNFKISNEELIAHAKSKCEEYIAFLTLKEPKPNDQESVLDIKKAASDLVGKEYTTKVWDEHMLNVKKKEKNDKVSRDKKYSRKNLSKSKS